MLYDTASVIAIAGASELFGDGINVVAKGRSRFSLQIFRSTENWKIYEAKQNAPKQRMRNDVSHRFFCDPGPRVLVDKIRVSHGDVAGAAFEN